MSVLGVVTIGQSPRDDLTGELARYLPAGTGLLERGALDGLSASGVAALAPAADEDVLTTRLRDGGSAVLDRRLLVPLLEKAVCALEDDGAEMSLLVCTGTFPRLRRRRPLLDAEHLLVRGVGAIADGGPLGVVVPLAAQQRALSQRWRQALDLPVIVEAADPYAGGAAEAVPAAADRLAGRGARIAVLDCMGFTEGMRRSAAARSGVPVLLARSVVGRLTAELLGALPGR